MTPTAIDQNLIDRVVALSHEAGRAILAVYQRGFSIETKTDDSPVTEADLAAHRVIVATLATLLDDVPVLSEESRLPPYAVRRQWRRYWIVDPLDGTKEFISRNGEFTVNIALIDNGVPILGVVHVPVQATTYAGAQGFGAWKWQHGVRRAIHVRSMAERLARQLPIELVASRRHGADAVDELVRRVQTLGPVASKNMGSSLKLCLVAEGEADLYPRLAPTSEWDTAAAQAVVEAAGGIVVDDRFRLLRYNAKDDILNPYFYVIGDKDYDWRGLLLSETR